MKFAQQMNKPTHSNKFNKKQQRLFSIQKFICISTRAGKENDEPNEQQGRMGRGAPLRIQYNEETARDETYLESNIVGHFTEALTAGHQVILADDGVSVSTDSALARALSVLTRMRVIHLEERDGHEKLLGTRKISRDQFGAYSFVTHFLGDLRGRDCVRSERQLFFFLAPLFFLGLPETSRSLHGSNTHSERT